MKKIIFAACLLAVTGGCPKRTMAQDSDLGTWLSLDMSKDIFRKFDLEFEEEARIFKNYGEIDRFETSLGGVYSLNKYLKGGMGYTWIYRHNLKHDLWENRNRYYAYISGKVYWGRLTFSLREKFQSTYYDKSIKGFDYSPHNYLRSRLGVNWDVKNSKLQPFTSAEMYYQLNNPDGNNIDEIRYTLGVEFPLNKKLDLDTYLRLNREMNVNNPVYLYLLGIELNLDL